MLKDAELLLNSFGSFEVGGLYSELESGNKPIENYDTAKWRIRSKKQISIQNDIRVSVYKGFKAVFRSVVNGNANKEGNIEILSFDTKIVPKGTYRIMIHKISENQEEIANVQTFLESVHVIPQNSTIVNMIQESIFNGECTFKDFCTFENGGISGIDDYNIQTWRIRNSIPFVVSSDIKIQASENMKIIFHKIIDGVYSEKDSFDVITTKITNIPKGNYRVCLFDVTVSSGNANIDELASKVKIITTFDNIRSNLEKLNRLKYIPWKIQAHQGEQFSSGIYQGNMLSNIIRAYKSECEICEIDLQLTKDKELVLCHDATVGRLTIADTNLKDLQKVVIAVDPLYGEQHILTLDTAFSFGKRYGMNFALDVSGKSDEILKLTAQKVMLYGMQEQVAYNCSANGVQGVKLILDVDGKAKFHWRYADLNEIETSGIENLDNKLFITLSAKSETISKEIVLAIRKKYPLLIWGIDEDTKHFLWEYCPDIAEYAHNADIETITKEALANVDAKIIF